MHKSKRKWLCVDCGEHTKYEHYFLKNEVWMGEAKMGEVGMLCVGCVEGRINRTLKPSDFTSAHINNPKKNMMSDRLRTRIVGS